jgi:ClpP class serine protease
MDAASGLMGYDSIRARFDAALRDPEVHGIALMVNSSGGEVSGMFDLADRIYEARGEKPIWAILDESAY